MAYLRHDMCISRSLEMYGEWSEGEFDIFRQVLSPGDVVVEVGANIGTHTVGLAQAVGDSGAVIAFEPQRFVFQLLCANIALNGLLNVHTRFCALGASSGTINVPMFDFSAVNNVGGLIIGGDSGEQVALEALDGMGFQRIKLLKIDVEGMEADVLAGAAQTIRNCQPVIYIENEFKDKSGQLIGMLQDLGYRMWWHLPPMYNPANFFGNARNIFPGIVSKNMLCLPLNGSRSIKGLREVAGPEDRP
jgi:FkbM family methyltransferase